MDHRDARHSAAPSRSAAEAKPNIAARSTESELALPSVGKAVQVFGRALRLRCPNCGRGKVIRGWADVRPRCSGCNFRFERSDESYFSGAMFFGLMIGEFIFGVSLLVIILSTWPHVPWDTMQWVGPVGMLVVMVFVLPLSQVVWLAVDVLVRPVQEAEKL